MKTIRYAAACLLLITTILHLYVAIKHPSGPNFKPFLTFGVIYFVIGALILMKKKLAVWLGLIVPIIPLTLIPYMIAHKNLGKTMTVFLAIDVIIIICCLILLLNKIKS